MDNEPGLLAELKRRKVVRTGVVYAAAAFATLEFADIAFPRIGLSDGAVDIVLWAGLLGFPIALALAWFFDVRPDTTSGQSHGWFSVPALAAAALLVGMGVGAGMFWGGGESAEDTVPRLTISPLTTTVGLNLSGSWSPDGSQIAYDYTLNGTMDVAVSSLGGGEPRLLGRPERRSHAALVT